MTAAMPYKNKYKKEAWEWCSRYIRLRDTDKNQLTSCITCGKKNHPKDVDAGHFISRTHNSTLFDERNIFAQCKFCNAPGLGGDDAKRVFRQRAIERIGEDEVVALEQLSNLPTKISDLELMALTQDYKQRVEELLNSKGIMKWWQ